MEPSIQYSSVPRLDRTFYSKLGESRWLWTLSGRILICLFLCKLVFLATQWSSECFSWIIFNKTSHHWAYRDVMPSTMKIRGLTELLCYFVMLWSFQGHVKFVVTSSDVSESGRSFVCVFDTTWSMDDDLQELRAGAAHIVKEMQRKDTNPIFNYVFVPFNDPCKLCLSSVYLQLIIIQWYKAKRDCIQGYRSV